MTKKRKTRLLIILGILVGVLTIAYFQFDNFVERMVRQKLTLLINQSPDRLYEYEFDKLNINLLDGSLTLRKVGLIPTSHALDSIKSTANPIRSIMELKVDKIEMNGFEIRKFLKTGELEVDEFLIRRPEFKLFLNPDKKPDATKKTDTFDEILTDDFTTAKLNSFNIVHGTFSITNVNQESNPLKIDSINFILNNALADRNTIRKFIPFNFSDFSFTSTGISMDVSNDFYITSDKLEIDASATFIKVFNFQIHPKYNFEAFSAKYDVQKQWFALVVDELHLHRIRLDQLYSNGEFSVEKLEIFKANVALFKDKSKPAPPFKIKPLPATVIRSIPFMIDIDTTIIENALVTINERSGLTNGVSNLTFNALNAVITGFTNDSIIQSQNPNMLVEVTTKVMGVANVKMNIDFNLLSDTDEFSAWAHVDSVSATVFNEVLKPMMAVEVKSGKILHVDLAFNAMDTLSTGTLDMEYSNVKIDVLNPDLENAKKQGFMSFAANTVIKSNNFISQSNYVQGVINVPRVMEKDVFPYLWHSIQSGMVSTLVPITNKREAKQQQKQVKKELRQEKKNAKEKR